MTDFETTAEERARWLPVGEVAPDVAAVLRDLNRALAEIARLKTAVLEWGDAAHRQAAEVARLTAADGWRTIDSAIEAAKSNDGWIGRSLFGKMRQWGWEEWVGQCDAGDIWLGRSGDGTCFDTDEPTHWQPLPSPPAEEKTP
jgi:hypothetical protein